MPTPPEGEHRAGEHVMSPGESTQRREEKLLALVDQLHSSLRAKDAALWQMATEAPFASRVPFNAHRKPRKLPPTGQLAAVARAAAASGAQRHPWWEAAAACDVPWLSELHAEGAGVNEVDCDLRTAAHVAASEGALGTLELLIDEWGANVNPIDRWGCLGGAGA